MSECIFESDLVKLQKFRKTDVDVATLEIISKSQDTIPFSNFTPQSHVKTLVLKYAGLNLKLVQSLPVVFPNLERLSLSFCWFSHDENWEEQLPSTLHLKALRLEDHHNAGFLPFLKSFASNETLMKTLQEISIGKDIPTDREEDQRIINQLLKSCPRQLESLKLSICNNGQANLPPLLLPTTNLRELYLSDELVDCNILRSFQTAPLEKLVYEYYKFSNSSTTTLPAAATAAAASGKWEQRMLGFLRDSNHREHLKKLFLVGTACTTAILEEITKNCANLELLIIYDGLDLLDDLEPIMDLVRGLKSLKRLVIWNNGFTENEGGLSLLLHYVCKKRNIMFGCKCCELPNVPIDLYPYSKHYARGCQLMDDE